jgi:hypothetical protein
MTEPWPLSRLLPDDTAYLGSGEATSLGGAALVQDVERDGEIPGGPRAHQALRGGDGGRVAGCTFLTSSDAFEIGLTTLIARANKRSRDVNGFLSKCRAAGLGVES